MMEYTASYREQIIEISGTIVWNVLEHIASRYWKTQQEDQLYKLKDKAFKKYIKSLRRCADQIIEDKIGRDDILIDHPDYKSLLKVDLKPEVLPYPPPQNIEYFEC